ncbi:MAG: EAL domain-containing protein [Bacillota bacterium]
MRALPASPAPSVPFREALELARPFFQPLVSLRQRRIVGYEALARGPQGTVWESPAALFAEAEAQGLLSLLECRIWEAAFQVWEARFPGLMLCINAHPGSWRQFRLPEHPVCPLPRLLVNGQLRQGGRLVVEVPERLTLSQSAEARRQADQLRAAGIQLWLDDLGSGVAGLQFLPLLRPDGIKLDRLLVGGVDADPYRRAVVRALVGAARELGLTLVAEGVETEAELGCLAALGVDLAQGFLLGRPAPEPRPLAPDVAALLARLPVPDAPKTAGRLRPGRVRGRRTAVWPALGALSRALSQARSLREALGHVGRALTEQLACDGVLILGESVAAQPSHPSAPPSAGGGVSVVMLDGVLWPSVPGPDPVAGARGRLGPPRESGRLGVRFHADLHLPDPVWEPVYALSARLGFSRLLTIPVPASGPRVLVWAVGWRRPVRLDPEAFAVATVLADYTALEWRRWTCPPPAPTTGAGAAGAEDGP